MVVFGSQENWQRLRPPRSDFHLIQLSDFSHTVRATR
jgi:hypothetical protein